MSDTVAELPRSLRLLIGTVIAKRYVVDNFLGMGGMAVVFRGRHATLDRNVAIKFLRPEYSTNAEVSARFDREARAASTFEHPNCIQVFDCGETVHGIKFMVMPLLEGVELGKVIEQPLPASQCTAIALQLLGGLDHAHAQSVVHRDLKPDNIFVTLDHENREVLKIVDFGIAKIVDPNRFDDGLKTKVGAVVGTPAYMSPEQAMGGDIDARTDLYALGVILYQLLSGALPFVAADPRGLLFQHVTMEPPPLPKGVPEPLRAIVLKLMAKEPNDRPQSTAEAIAAFDRVRLALRSDATPWVRLLERQRSQPAPAVQPRAPMPLAAGRSTKNNAPGSTDVSGPNDVPTPDPSHAEPLAGPPTEDGLAAMDDALQKLLNTETAHGQASLRSGIFEIPPGGWPGESVGPVVGPPPSTARGRVFRSNQADDVEQLEHDPGALEHVEELDDVEELDEIDEIEPLEESPPPPPKPPPRK